MELKKENQKMLDRNAVEFIEMLSSKAPVPGGGGAASAVGALAGALGMMVTNLTVGKKTYADVEEEILQVGERLKVLRDQLIDFVDKDAEAFEPLAKAYSLPKETEKEKDYKEKVMAEALYTASVVPLESMEIMYEVMENLKVLGEKGSKMALSDVGVGILFARAAVESASLNVFINTKSMKDRELAQKLNEKAETIIQKAKDLESQVYGGVVSRLK